MWLAILIMIVALVTNIWLWGHWSFDKSSGLTLMLVANALLLGYVFLAPVLRFLKKKKLKEAFLFWPIRIAFYVVIVLTLILSASSFYGLIQYLLPIKLLLLGAYTFLKLKHKRFFAKKTT